MTTTEVAGWNQPGDGCDHAATTALHLQSFLTPSHVQLKIIMDTADCENKSQIRFWFQ